MTIANAAVVAGIFYAILGSVRTRHQIENGRTHWGLAMVLIGFVVIALHYLATLAAMHLLPQFLSVSDSWTILRALRQNGYWVITGSGLLCLVCGLHFVFRDLRSLSTRLQQADDGAKR